MNDLPLLYDIVLSSGLAEKILSEIPQDEYDQIVKSILNSIKAIYAYQHSALGILNAVATDYSNLKFDANEIQQKLADPNNIRKNATSSGEPPLPASSRRCAPEKVM